MIHIYRVLIPFLETILVSKRFENVRKRGCSDRNSDSLREYDDFVNALSITSNSLTGRQRKRALSHGWRIARGYVMLPLFL